MKKLRKLLKIRLIIAQSFYEISWHILRNKKRSVFRNFGLLKNSDYYFHKSNFHINYIISVKILLVSQEYQGLKISKNLSHFPRGSFIRSLVVKNFKHLSILNSAKSKIDDCWFWRALISRAWIFGLGGVGKHV